MADKRIWAKIDLGYLSNPKMSDVLDASSNAVLMHLASILHSAQHLTDGEASPKAMQRTAGGSQEDVDILIRAGLWHLPGHDCDQCPQPSPGRIYVHNYLEHNVSSTSVSKASEDGKRAAKARWEKEKKRREDAERMPPASEPHAERMQDPLPNAMLDREIDQIDKPSSTADAEDGFDEWYSAYPRKEGKGAARKAFKAALKKTSLENLKAGLSAYCREVQGKERRHIAMPASWLNAERWDDEYAHNLTGVQDSDIDPDAILGKDYWMPADPPEGLTMQEEIEWKRQQRANRRAVRIEEAKRRLNENAAAS